MNKKYLSVTLGAALVALVTAAGVYGQDTSTQNPVEGRRAGPGRGGPGGPGGPGMGRGRRGGPMGRRALGVPLPQLDLTSAQHEQVRAITKSHRQAHAALGERGAAAHQALEAAVTADAVDEAAIRAKSADVAAVQADLAVARATLRSAIVQILTPEQQSKAKELQQQAATRRPIKG